ncbi:PR-1-like protein [Ophiobolus disseminans]|uniref:PR-1-like protein n=1 Tax=Ophiobolus disseminans TaxID=1469910 RepID=A0A6A6ZBX9_9PLEO|nr:PR-1-like protein [Ophiobolus disseminans]
MHSSILFASALVAGAIAMPHLNPHLSNRRNIVTEVEVAVETVVVVVTVTAGEDQATSTSSCISTTAVASSSPVAAPSSSVFSQPPTPTPTPEDHPKHASPTPQPSAPPDTHVKGPKEAYLSFGPEYAAAMLYHHNAARANHEAEPLTWDDACESNARLAAQRCNFKHYLLHDAGQGQNLFTVTGEAFNATAGVTESWYKGEMEPMMPWFGKTDVPDDVFHEVGHLTQLVWKGTTKVGCVSIDCGDKMIVGGAPSKMNKFTVCNYAPAGNVEGGYAANVVAPLSKSHLGGWAD